MAHSHGGNVALYANRTEAEPLYDALVTLGTPFVRCQRRNLERFMDLYRGVLRWSSAALLALLLYLLIRLLNSSDVRFDSETSIRALVIGVVFFLALVIAKTVAPSRVTLGTRFRAAVDRLVEAPLRLRQDEVLARIGLPVPRTPILCCLARRDEAQLWLSLLGRIGNVPARVSRFVWDVLVVSVMGPLSLVLFACSGAFIGVALALALIIVWFVGFTLWPLLVRGHPGGFGGERAFDNALVRIDSVAMTPGPDVSARTFVLRGLRHAALHDAPEVIDVTASWLLSAVPRGRLAKELEG